MDKVSRPVRAPTAEDVARRAGVHRSAVSRTFTPGASVAPETREKVLEAARELGYRVNFLARSLSNKRTDLIGLVVSDIDNPFRAQLLAQLGASLVAAGYRPFLLPTEPGGNVARHIDMMLHYNVSGAIVTDDASPAEIALECERHRVPLVLINKMFSSEKVLNVSMDTGKAGRLAAQELHRAGCRTIALASQRRSSHSIGLRRTAFLTEAERLGMAVKGEFFGPVQNYQGGREAADAFLADGLRVDGIYCANDYLALGFIDTIRHRSNFSIPLDLKLAACDDIAEAGWLAYDLTTVRQDPLDMADAAVNGLLSRIEDPASNATPTVVDVQLVTRGSTGALSRQPHAS